MHEAAGLVGIVALGDVLLDERNCALRIKIKRDAGERAGWVLRFFLEEGDAAGASVEMELYFLISSRVPTS